METSQEEKFEEKLRESLKGSVCIVTGAGQGIGLSTVRVLLKAGVKVSMIDVSSKLPAVCDKLNKEFGANSVLCLNCDVTDENKLRKAFEKTIDHYGTLNIVINNAGIADEVNWDKMLQINLHAVISGTYLGMELMPRGGVIVNMASMSALYPVVFTPVYSSSKMAVVTFTRAIKYTAEACNVRVNCICPYYVDTEMSRRDFDSIPEPFKSEIIRNGIMSPDQVAQGIMELITDCSKNGAVLRASAKRGLSYHIFNDNLSKSKL